MNTHMNKALSGAFMINDANKHKTKSPSKRRPTKAKNTQPKQRPTYPWTCLLDVKLVGKLDAIQKTFNLNNRSDALALIINHCSKLIQSNEQRIEYKIFYKKFMQKNLPKAKRHYDKYFHK